MVRPVRPFKHCTAAVIALSTCGSAVAQTPAVPTPAPVPGEASFNIFIRGRDAGREQVSVQRSGSNWVITSTGRVGDLIINRFELKYTADWQPVDLRIEATQGDRKMQLATSFGVTTAINEITQNGVTNAKTDEISARTIVLPNNFYAAYEGVAARLAGAQPGAEFPVYVAPQTEVKLIVTGAEAEQIQTPSGMVVVRRYAVRVQNPGGVIEASVAIDDRARFARLDIPAAALAVVRSDLASVAVRTQAARNPTDSDVTIPANGFNIAGTLTSPPGVGRLRHPTVVLVAGSGPVDRDETVAGIPIFSQLAGALAERGYLVFRYDKRGLGQSGGRTETATIQDYADDLVAIVKWLAKRDDVDNRRIAVVGHSEGGSVAMLAAAREKKIASVVLAAAPGTAGAELILEQQQHQLALAGVPAAEKQEKVALQQKIQQAVITGKGWEDVPPELRKQADIPWFRSFLMFDPAVQMTKFKQPILVIQGDLDAQVAPHHADKLGELARQRKKAGAVDVVHLPGVNHLLVKAKTGEVSEYADLPDKRISPDVATTIADWLKR
jgi:pimeloyl-ACP methyl ester carboxylesterase